jgi:uncharacterized protein YdhG (YjbR/CyaY superfamily)
MSTGGSEPRTIDEYITAYPDDVQRILAKIRKTIREAAPEAQETIKYQIPTFTLYGNLISFAAYKKHIGLYPATSGTKAFNNKLSVFRTAKSTVRFPLDKPIPFDLISQMVKLRVKENQRKARAKAHKQKRHTT